MDVALQRGQTERAARWAKVVMAIHHGPLLVDEGAADWVMPLRDTCGQGVVRAALCAARSSLAEGSSELAVKYCQEGLHVDGYHDGLWQLRIEALTAGGMLVEAKAVRREFDLVMTELFR
jgi:hypothetical protein